MTRLVEALKEVGQTFELFQRGEIGPCESTPVSVQVPNLVPSSYCRIPGAAPPPGDEVIDDRCKGVPPATPRVLTYTQKDVIDDHISIPAQHSLVRLSKNPDTSADAVGMLEAVKSRQLEGIYCVNWQKPALRAREFNSNWWTVIPEGEDAVLMLDPEDSPHGLPMIAFRNRLHNACGDNNGDLLPDGDARLDASLMSAWQTYKLFRKCELVPCANNPSAIPVSNLVPPSFCQLKPRKITLRLLTDNRKTSYDSRRVAIVIDGKNMEPMKSDGKGFLSVEVPIGTRYIQVSLLEDEIYGDPPLYWNFEVIDQIPAADTTRGALIRLKNLNYYQGHIIDEMTEEAKESLGIFQWDWDLDVTMELDNATVLKLREVHDVAA